MARRERILVISHGHPDFSKGGGELAAYNLFKAYQKNPGVEEAWFVARHDLGGGPSGAISMRREREYIWDQTVADWFYMKAANFDGVNKNFSELVKRFNPTLVHVHHYVHMGLEYLQVIKRELPDTRIMMTIHEYIAICFNQGQMIKKGTNQLCFGESPVDCNRCFPEHSQEDFWLRKHRYLRFFDLIEQFVAPSDFLRQRYIEWGIPSEKITTIENGQAESIGLSPRKLEAGETRNRFAFFGQINPFKGVDLILKALSAMTKEERRKILVEIHGSNLEGQSLEFQKMIAELRAPLEQEGCIQWVGPYEPFQMADRIARVDWVIVPSIWWENSPMVIQEAFTLSRPLVVSNIGGMAEKVSHGVNGIHVPVNNTAAWSETLLKLAKMTHEWELLRDGIVKPVEYDECAKRHLELVLN